MENMITQGQTHVTSYKRLENVRCYKLSLSVLFFFCRQQRISFLTSGTKNNSSRRRRRRKIDNIVKQYLALNDPCRSCHLFFPNIRRERVQTGVHALTNAIDNKICSQQKQLLVREEKKRKHAISRDNKPQFVVDEQGEL